MIRYTDNTLLSFEGEVWPWRGGDLQTLRHFIMRDIPDLTEGEMMTAALDDGDQLLAAFHRPQGQVCGGIIAVHGLTGCMDSDHIKVLSRDALRRGYAVLRVNMRGAGPARSLAKRSYSAKSGSDLLPFISMIRSQIGNDLPVMMVAHSIGGAAALNMVLDYPDRLQGLDGLISVAAPIDMLASSKRFHQFRNCIYMRHLLNRLKVLVNDVPGIDPDLLSKVKTVSSIWEFDDLYTGPNIGYADAAAYYSAATTCHRLEHPSIPILLIHADNDPWIPVGAYLTLNSSETLDILVSRGGGHVGFHDRKGVWSNRAAFAWFDSVIKG
jgi:predicted alpha/beta-fold hydrolase